MSRFGQHVGIATSVAFPIGLVAGLAAALYWTSVDPRGFTGATGPGAIWLFGLLGAAGALVCAMALLPIALLFSVASTRWQERCCSARVYAAFLVIGLASLHSILWLHINVFRNRTAAGTVAATAVLLAAPFAAAALVAFSNRRASRRQHAMSWRTGARLVFLLVAVVLGSYVALSQRVSATGDGNLIELARRAAGSGAPRRDPSAAVHASRPANVLLISIDTLRADHVGIHGYSRGTTPHIDALAREGVWFAAARSHAPWTLASHATMFTSLYSSSHGARSISHVTLLGERLADRLADSNITLAERLKRAGFRTGALVKSRWLTADFGMHQGFDTLRLTTTADARKDVESARSWIEESGSRPFFLFLHFMDVHHYTAPPDYTARFVDPDYRGPIRPKALLTSINGYDNLSGADIAQLQGLYDAGLRYVDDQLGRLFETLRASGVYDDTLIIVTSDHGEEFWDHGGTGHGFTLYEEQLRVPLVMKPPGPRPPDWPPNVAVSVGLIDIVPTVLDFLGLAECGSACEGVSLKRVIEIGGPVPRPLLAGDTYFHNSVAAVEGRFKFISNAIPPRDPFNIVLLLDTLRTFYRLDDDELFDLIADPVEKRNVLKTHTAAAERLEAVVMRHVESSVAAERFAMDEETIEQLRSLGYIR